jgi:hypothetical protein
MPPHAQPGPTPSAAQHGLSASEVSTLVKELRDRFQASQGGSAWIDARIQPWRQLSAIPALLRSGLGGAGSGGAVQAPSLPLPADPKGVLGAMRMADLPLNALGDGCAMSRPIEISSAPSGSTSTASGGTSSSRGISSTPSNRSTSSSGSSSSHEDTDEEGRTPANFSLDFILNPRDPDDRASSGRSSHPPGKPGGTAASQGQVRAAEEKVPAAVAMAVPCAGAASPSPSKNSNNVEVVPRYWSEEEHLRFLEGIRLHGPNNHMAIAKVRLFCSPPATSCLCHQAKSRRVTQTHTRTHALVLTSPLGRRLWGPAPPFRCEATGKSSSTNSGGTRAAACPI